MMLTGYAPSAAAVEAVGTIAQELKLKATLKPGSFFWVLDPVMGDNEKLYVAEDVVPAYASLVQHADLILPNQYEAEFAITSYFFRAKNAKTSHIGGYRESKLPICGPSLRPSQPFIPNTEYHTY
jgi:pyridoxal/pyridoxine/pyridoxamine kinase